MVTWLRGWGFGHRCAVSRPRGPAGVAAACLLLFAVVPAVAAGAEDGGATAPANCQPPTAGTHRIVVNAAWPPVLLHVPPVSAGETGPRPLVLVLPGTNQTGRQVAALTGYSRLADQRHFLVAYATARGPRPQWGIAPRPGQPDADLDYLRAVVVSLRGTDACADPARIVVTGVSNGGGMTARLACDATDLIAAAAPVAGGYSTLPACTPPRPMPILEIHGARDPTVPIDGRGPDHAGSVASYLAGWTARDGCAAAPSVRGGARRVTRTRWTCAGGTVVQHDRVEDVGHDWPGEGSLRPFSATVATWQFLSSFRLPAPGR
jgi:polyhydroxybutyrate depolymerase